MCAIRRGIRSSSRRRGCGGDRAQNNALDLFAHRIRIRKFALSFSDAALEIGMIRSFFIALSLGVSCVSIEAVNAETLNYFYVGSAPKVSNIVEAENRSALNLGFLTIDTSKIPDGQDINSFEIRYGDEESSGDPSYFEAERLTYSITDIGGCCFNSGFAYVNISVVGGNIVNWNVATNSNGGIVRALFSDRDVGDRVLQFNPGAADEFAVETIYRTGLGGRWFREDELGAYSLAILNNTREAISNPPASDFNTAPIPIPAPFALLAGGIFALVLIRRKSAKGA